ncbi:deoxyribonuclease V [Arcicella rosea]|uniref:Endonuclease V n=1 Tax=Arcicella rosea TaxID=502909 RepID=A0A841EX92_9BACT|nr:deoxyribonuclease V [Arcicella rosea]MBB6005703.1 deoxyinosine 3'endonuclease (endonuclease V) [Arcicella rosea]
MIEFSEAINFLLLDFRREENLYYYSNKPYTGLIKQISGYSDYDILLLLKCVNGNLNLVYKKYIINSKSERYKNFEYLGEGTELHGFLHGYSLTKIGGRIDFRFDDFDILVEKKLVDAKGYRVDKWSWRIFDDIPNMENEIWVDNREGNMEVGGYKNDTDFLPYYTLQNEMREKVIKEDRLPSAIKYIAGVDVAYHEVLQKMVGGIVVLDAETLEVVETALHEMEISFPYIPGLFSFREIPPLLEAYKKLNIKPDLIVCDAHGLAHPQGVGMATHLGIELDIPTIGCAKKRLVGYYDKEALGTQRGDSQSLIWDSQEAGKALRTQDNIKSMFVSIGHKISLETACEWVLKLCPNYRLPETTRAVDHLVNQVLKERTDFNLFPEDDNEEAFQ